MYSRYDFVRFQFSSSTYSVRTSALYFFESFRVVGWWLVRHCRLRQRTIVIEMSSEYCFSFLVQCIIVSSTLLGGTVLLVHGGGGGRNSSSSSNGDRRKASFVWRRVVISIVWMALLLLLLLLLRYPPFGQSSLLYPVFKFHIPDVGM